MRFCRCRLVIFDCTFLLLVFYGVSALLRYPQRNIIFFKYEVAEGGLPRIDLILHFRHRIQSRPSIFIMRRRHLRIPDQRTYFNLRLIMMIARCIQLILAHFRFVIVATFYVDCLDFQAFFVVVDLLHFSLTIFKKFMMNVFFDLVVVVGELDLTLVFCEALNHYPQLLIIRRAIILKLINLLGNIRQQARLRLLAELL